MNPQISVIVPVYNGERYLYECIDSILNQSFTDFELILVDDGSKDGSGQICDNYAKKDQRVRVIHKQNEGINATRKRGVQEAKGIWICFCDNDDSLPADALSDMFCLTDNTDIVIGFPETPCHKKQLTLTKCRQFLISGKRVPPTPWAKLYRRNILSDDVFDFPREIDGEEDMIMNIRLFFKIERPPRFIFKKVYNFRRNPISVSHTKVSSIEHEEIFDSVRSLSIPPHLKEAYMPYILHNRINGLVAIAANTPDIICVKRHPYMKRLMHDIEQYNYHCSPIEWTLLHITSTLLVKFIANLWIISNFIKYHTGLVN